MRVHKSESVLLILGGALASWLADRVVQVRALAGDIVFKFVIIKI